MAAQDCGKAASNSEVLALPLTQAETNTGLKKLSIQDHIPFRRNFSTMKACHPQRRNTPRPLKPLHRCPTMPKQGPVCIDLPL